MTDYEEMDEMDGAGVDTAVAEPVATPEPPVETPEPETPPEVVEETPEQIEEKKRLSGSARQKAKADRLAHENQQLQERLARLEAQVNPQATPKAEVEGKPTQDQFETHAEWVEALTDWKVKNIVQAEKAKEQTEKVNQSWEQKKNAARAEIPDFDEVLADMETPAPVVVAVMAESEHSAKIAYHLAQHPDELQKINKMSPAGAALAIGKIAAAIEAPKPEKKATQAPPPLVPVKAAAIAVKADRHSGLEEF